MGMSFGQCEWDTQRWGVSMALALRAIMLDVLQDVPATFSTQTLIVVCLKFCYW